MLTLFSNFFAPSPVSFNVDGLTPSSVCTVTLRYGIFFVLAIVLEDFSELILNCILTRNGAKYPF